MLTVFEAQHFNIVAPDRPHVSRGDGGHLIINPKVVVEDRTQLARAGEAPAPQERVAWKKRSVFRKDLPRITFHSIRVTISAGL